MAQLSILMTRPLKILAKDETCDMAKAIPVKIRPLTIRIRHLVPPVLPLVDESLVQSLPVHNVVARGRADVNSQDARNESLHAEN